MNKVIAIIPARMGSTRLPKKIMLPLAGKNVLQWCYDRVSASKMVDQTIITTYRHPDNREIWRQFPDTYVYDGEASDVIGRVLNTAMWAGADIICDITSDCPLVSNFHIDFLVKELIDNNYDFISNDIIDRSWPDGLDIMIYKKEALERCIKLYSPTKHTGWNIAMHPEEFKICHVKAPDKYNLPHWGLTLDEEKDYEVLKAIFFMFGTNKIDFKIEDVLDWLIENPEILEINNNVRRKDPEKES